MSCSQMSAMGQKLTCASSARMSASCHKQTSLSVAVTLPRSTRFSARLLLAPFEAFANVSPFEKGPAFAGLGPFPDPAAYYHPAAFPYADIDGGVRLSAGEMSRYSLDRDPLAWRGRNSA